MIRLANRLGATMTLPSTISMRRVPLAISVPTVPHSRGDGSVVVGRSRVQARQFSLTGSIYYADRQQIRDAADNLLQFLQHPPIEVFRWPHTDPRRLYAYPMGMSQDWMDAGAELGLDIPMLAPDPYWYGSEATSSSSGSGAWTVNVEGTAPTHPVVQVDVAASGSGSIVIQNSVSGQRVEMEGPWQSGDGVTVDTGMFGASLQRRGTASPSVDRMSDEFVADGFELYPGINTLTYTGPTAAVMVAFRPRWL